MESTESLGRSSHVLVVDDSRGVRLLLRRLIEDWGYSCADVEDGAMALAYASAHEIDLVVTDFEMPHLDGLGLIGALQQRATQQGRGAPPIVMVTGRASKEVQDAAYATGIVAVVPKPVDTSTLRAIVDGVLQHVRVTSR
jgi:CheY-like chemotaxis protein